MCETVKAWGRHIEEGEKVIKAEFRCYQGQLRWGLMLPLWHQGHQCGVLNTREKEVWVCVYKKTLN